MNKLIRGFVRKCKRFGFTLAEALIVTVMAGYSILPILGTMQNASNRAEAYDHNSKMVQYTRSRLTKEIANASFDHCAVSTEDKYHYIVYFDPTGDENKAVRMEIPETAVTPEELRTVDINSTGTLASEACTLLGLSTTLNSAYLKIIYAYKTSVQTNDGILIADYTEDVNYQAGELGPKGLMGIVVTTRLIEDENFTYNEDGYMLLEDNVVASDTFVAPVSNFSLVNLPTVSDEYIWVCDSLNLKLIAIDPVSKTVASTIALPRSAKKTDKPDDKEHDSYRPWRIALHPSGKIMAVLLKNNIMYVNLDKKSPDYGKCKKQMGADTNLAFCNPDKDAQKAIKDGGMVFRPDGKYLFFTKKEAKTLIVFKFDYTINSSTNVLDWSSVKCTEVSSASLNGEKNEYVGLVASSNGYLYLAYKDKDLGVYKVSMYPPDDDFAGKWSAPSKIGYYSYKNDLMGIAVNQTGTHLAVVLDDKSAAENNVLILDANTGAFIGQKKYEEVCRPAFIANANASNDINDRTLTVNVTNREGKDNVSATSLAIGDDRLVEYGSYKTMAGGPGGGPAANKYKAYQVIPSPIPGELVLTEKDKPHLVFIKSNTKADAETIITAENTLELAASGPKNDHSISDIAAIPRDILAVSCSGTITLYDMNVMKKIEDNNIIATDTPEELKMSPNGEMLIGTYANKRINASRFYLSDYTSGADLELGNYVRKAAFDDRSQNMLFFLNDNRSGNITASSTAIYNMNADFASDGDWACSTDSIYFRGDFKLSNGWNRLDMIGLPKGGYMALFGKSDGTSMLEWVGRIPREYPVNANKYSLFARWVNVVEGANTTLPDNINLTGSTLMDHWQGRIAVCKEKFPVGSVITSLTASIGTDTGWTSSKKRFITPVILQGNINSSLKIVDYATPIGFSNAEGTVTRAISGWQSGGKIAGDDYYVGFYSGNRSSSICEGAIEYAEDSSGFTYVADYHVDGTGDGETDGQISPSDIAVGTNLVPHGDLNDKKRKYALSFTAQKLGAVGFPPAYSRSIAISPDTGTLVILSGNNTDSNATPTISLFDFNNFNFLNETQIEGMLVDYREKFQSGIYDESTKELKTAPVYPWPNEEESLFKSVLDEGRIITDFKSVTTKYDTFTPFNQFPANYFVNTDSDSGIKKVKGNANKRVFGYISDDKDFTNLQGIPSEDSRFFYNNKILGGRLEQSGEALYEPSLYIGLNPYQSGLLQLDQTSNGQKNRSAIFLGKKDAGSPSSYLTTQGYNKILNKDYSVCGWNTLRSDQTYILRNQPTLMKSFVAKDNGSPAKILGINYAEMMFSRDRANPVLYISDKTNNCVWAIGRDASNNYKLVRFNLGSINLTGAMAISSDGTKLFVGCSAEATTSTGGTGTKASAKKNEIRVYNIAKPDTSVFDVSSLVKDLSTAPSPNAATYTAYLGTMSADASPVAMAAMPFVNYSTAGAVGDYTPISNATLNVIPVAYNGCMTIASGGLYIFPATKDNASRTILLYNPADSKLTTLSDVLKAPAPYSPITSYDDTLYVMGDDADGSKPTNRVQSYSVNERKAKTSLIVEPDSYDDFYTITYGVKADGTYEGLSEGSSYLSTNNMYTGELDCFSVRNSDYAVAKAGKEAYWEFGFNYPLTVNCMKMSNYDPQQSLLYAGGVANVKLEGSDNFGDSSISPVALVPYSGTNIGQHNSTGFYLKNGFNGFCKNYRIYVKDNQKNSTTKGGIVNSIVLMRQGVKRITPAYGASSIPTSNPYVDGKIKLLWRNPKETEHRLIDVYNNSFNSVYNYMDTSSYNEGWVPKFDATSDHPWVLCSLLNKAEAICTIRFINYKSDDYKKPTKIKVYATNDDDCANEFNPDKTITATFSPGAWTPLLFSNNSFEVSTDSISNRMITVELNNTKKYKHYLIEFADAGPSSSDNLIAISGFELYAQQSNEVSIDDDYLTGLEDDNRAAVKAGAGACCATPYGLVYTGGHVAESGYATNTALLYWPHAIDKYDGTYYKNGISRSLPSLGQARYNHAMVWLKGKIYCVGGAKDSSYTAVGINQFFEYLPTINTGAGNLQWKYISDTDINNPDSTLNNQLPRYYHGCCAFGDEIFIFGGQTGATTGGLNTAFAYNPETTDLRQLANLPMALSPCCAVAYGSKIYIIGKNGGKNYMYEYTP